MIVSMRGLLSEIQHVGNGNSIRNAIISYVVGSLVVAIVLALAGYVFNKNKRLYARMEDVYRENHEVRDVLIGETPSRYNPHPPPGVIQVVDQHTQDLNYLSKDVAQLLTNAGLKPTPRSLRNDA